jgi:Domain of unknown function (DUF1918)
MKAVPGDRLLVDCDPGRACEVIAVPQRDGSPPYVVRWERSGHIALVSPDSYAAILPARRREDEPGPEPRSEAE